MRILFLLIFVSFIAAIFAYISVLIDDDVDDRKAVYSYIDKTKSVPNGSPNNLFWFVQVSDIHVSRYRDFDRAPDLVKFCEDQLGIIKPDFVIASGDLTDAKHKDLRGSEQYRDEWQTYQEAVGRCQKVVNTWLDLRGNHDAFNTPDFDDKQNLFRQYSSQGRDHASSYVYHHRKAFGKYSFVGVDATPNPGPRRPFNFFGYVKQDGERLLYSLLNESRGSNVTMAFGHYPSSLIATQSGINIKTILRNVTAYVCGHLHTLAGLVPRMYAKHRTGMLEMELGDWKDERMSFRRLHPLVPYQGVPWIYKEAYAYFSAIHRALKRTKGSIQDELGYRIMAIDHDMLSVADARFGKWPVVMVTNPKEASLLAPFHEPTERMLNSTHIRILVFSDKAINNIEVHIDDTHLGKARHSDGPLYVLPWKPEHYKTGLHSIKVIVQDSVYGRHVQQHVFSLDGSSPLLPLRGRLILKLDVNLVLQLMFYALAFVYAGVLVLLRNCNNIKTHYIRNQPLVMRHLGSWYNRWLHRLWILTKVSKIYYPLLLFSLYLSVGPWFVAELVEGHLGVVFIWGMFVMGNYLPTTLPYAYGFFQMVTANIPITFFLAYCLQYRQYSPARRSMWHAARHIHFPFLCLIAFQTYMALSEFPAAYGTSAFIVGPVRTGSVILSLVLVYTARRTNVSSLIANHSS